MNKIESIVYNAVKKTPKVKLFLRNAYQSFFDILPMQKIYKRNDLIYKNDYFYGFHDISPFSYDNTKVLANHILISLRMPKQHDGLEVGYFPFDGFKLGDYEKVGVSYTWNYHKGCRLQWVNSDELIFNTYLDNSIKSEIVSVSKKSKRIIDFPIDTVSPSGHYATSFSYERLELLMP